MKNRRLRNRVRSANINLLISGAFAALIALGTALLLLPVASRSGRSCGWTTALFTATSATCVTGLVLTDTWTQFSAFGQTVILCLIEIGGLGFMSIASALFYLLRRKAGMVQRMVMAQSLGEEDLGDILRFQSWMLRGCLAIEGAGALILTLRFLPEFGFARALQLGVFHAVSAFCNAGFDILGFLRPGASISVYGTDAIILLTLSALVILGGLGFVVWADVLRKRSVKKWSVYTKLVLIATGALLLIGWFFFALFEWNNPLFVKGFSASARL